MNQRQTDFQSEDIPKKRLRKKLNALEKTAFIADVEAVMRDESQYVNALDFAHRHGVSVAYFQYWFPLYYERLMAHRRRVRKRLLLEKREAALELARIVVCKLFEQHIRLTRHRIQYALTERGLCVRDPEVRRAALDERAILERKLGVNASV